jgi:23S rRNA pseudouridine1911/1915/1917 synthase
MREIEIKADKPSLRLDLFLAKTLSGLSRTKIKELIEKGMVLIDGKTAKPSLRLKGHEVIKVILKEEAEPSRLIAEPISLDILYEDDEIVVVNKPPGMLVHPTSKIRSGTLVNALLYWIKDLGPIGGVLRPGIVHRLDKGTSGVLVVAKNQEAHTALLHQFKERKVKKVYLALVYGPLEGEGEVRLPIGYHPRYGLKRIPQGKKAKEAITLWRTQSILGDFSLLEVTPITGRTHQIRVHLSSIGHPLVGDPMYGRKKWVKRIPPELRLKIQAFSRPALHAFKIGFFHPRNKRWVEFTAPLSPDMKELLDEIHAYYKGQTD